MQAAGQFTLEKITPVYEIGFYAKKLAMVNLRVVLLDESDSAPHIFMLLLRRQFVEPVVVAYFLRVPGKKLLILLLKLISFLPAHQKHHEFILIESAFRAFF